jgi:hypothetical protein
MEDTTIVHGSVHLNTSSQPIKYRPNLVHKAKHQITYLAHQAHYMQDELKERLAQARKTKRETYMKYGF